MLSNMPSPTTLSPRFRSEFALFLISFSRIDSTDFFCFSSQVDPIKHREKERTKKKTKQFESGSVLSACYSADLTKFFSKSDGPVKAFVEDQATLLTLGYWARV